MKVVIADVVDSRFPKDKLDYRIQELENLVNTYGGVVIVKKIQKRWKPDYKTFVWWGKLDEIKQVMSSSWAEVLILWNILKAYQIYNLNEKLRDINAQARDRVDLILKIFAQHAKSPESKLQIELASLKHMWPRIFWMWMELSRQAWWIGTKWIWETNTEIMKRHLAKSVQQIETKLKKYEKVRQQHRSWRDKKWLATVWIVWYTNAGKSSLLNVLTNKWVLAEDKLFATLWTAVWELFLSSYDFTWKENLEREENKKILLNDTIWFIQNLPPDLIKAFQSTLEDSIEADLLFHVVDISDEFVREKIQVVDEILDQINARQKRVIIFNKIDKLSKDIDLDKIAKSLLWDDSLKNIDYFFVSTHDLIWLEKIKEFLFNSF